MNLGQTDTTQNALDTLSTSTDWNAITNAITAAGTALTTYQLEQINLTRAQQGLAPITSQAVAPTVNVGLSSQTMTMLAIGGVALIALLAFSGKRKS